MKTKYVLIFGLVLIFVITGFWWWFSRLTPFVVSRENKWLVNVPLIEKKVLLSGSSNGSFQLNDNFSHIDPSVFVTLGKVETNNGELKISPDGINPLGNGGNYVSSVRTRSGSTGDMFISVDLDGTHLSTKGDMRTIGFGIWVGGNWDVGAGIKIFGNHNNFVNITMSKSSKEVFSKWIIPKSGIKSVALQLKSGIWHYYMDIGSGYVEIGSANSISMSEDRRVMLYSVGDKKTEGYASFKNLVIDYPRAKI